LVSGLLAKILRADYSGSAIIAIAVVNVFPIIRQTVGYY